MKTLFATSIALLVVCSLHAQADYEKADSIAKVFNEPYSDAADLALKLIKPFSTEQEKARVIFAWVAQNIRYDYKKFKDPPPKPRIGGRTRQEVEKNLQQWHEKEIQKTLRNKKGVCADYSRLFQKMCAAAGLEAVTVTGVARRLNEKVNGKHAWNAVKIGGKWQLLDATWGAGHADDEDKRFIRCYKPAFFMTPPSLFILNHLPDDEQWQLLDKPIDKKEFNKQPMVNFEHPDFPVEAFSPEKGKVVLMSGKAEIRLKFSTMPDVLVVAAEEYREIPAQIQKTSDGWAVFTFSPGKVSEIYVFAGHSKRKTTMLAQFLIE